MESILTFVVLLGLGLVFGQYNERRHLQSLRRREAEFASLYVSAVKTVPEGLAPREAFLATGSTVVSIDYFKQVAAGLRGLLGGRVRSYESLIDRARREALLRLKQDAISAGADMVVNVRLETSSISKGNNDQLGTVEVYAYGTAIRL